MEPVELHIEVEEDIVTPKTVRQSTVFQADVTSLREKAKSMAAQWKAASTPIPAKRKSLQQKIGIRFVNAFRKENKGILWLQARDRGRLRDEHGRDHLSESEEGLEESEDEI